MNGPRPGSLEAYSKGCRCPRMDNCYGRGACGTHGPRATFYINEECPLHGAPPKLIEETNGPNNN